MPARRWSQDLILERICELQAQGSDLTPSEVGARGGRGAALVSAAERYFGNWAAAVRAAGIDYEQVRESGRRRRRARISKWSPAKIIAEIERLHQAGEDLSWAVMERKYHPLCAAAVKKCYFGSWGAALAAAGVDYEQVKATARRARRWRLRWRKELTERAHPNVRGAQNSRGAHERAPSPGRAPAPVSPTAAPGWARGLLREKAAEEERKQAEEN